MLLGFTGENFTMVAASKAAVRGVTVLKAEDDKTRVLNPHTLLAYAGEAGDTGTCSQFITDHNSDSRLLVQFAEYIQANVQLYGMRNNTPTTNGQLSPSAVASFIRKELSRSLRSRVCPFILLAVYSLNLTGVGP